VWFYDQQSRDLAAHQRELQRIEAELKALEKIVQEVKKFETDKASLQQKVEVVTHLQEAQRHPARLLDTVSRVLPDQVWLVELKEDEQSLRLTGKSFDNVGIASLMENLESSRLFRSVGLVESKSEILHGREVKAFTVIAQLAPVTTKEGVS
jgi:type IV pilus assembly protein PilN